MTIQDFKEKKIAVVIKSEQDLNKFLVMCDEAGLLWRSGDKASKWKPLFANKCVLVCNFADENCLAYTDDTTNGDNCGQFEEEQGYTLVDVSEFFGNVEKAHNEYKIVITCKDGKTTRAQMIVNGRTVKGAEAHCNPADKFNIAAGVKLAVDRLFEKKKKEDIPFTEIPF